MADALGVDTERRFSGMERLYGPESLRKLGNAHVVVAGVGGVGCWCAEALARSGIGQITLIDLDHIAESNVNRQLHALTETIGQSKVVAMGERILGINPRCRVNMVDDFVSPENIQSVLPADAGFIIDCTDQASAKIAMMLECRTRRIPLVTCGGAGGKTNPLSLRAGDLSEATNDALLSKLRHTLRRQHGYPRAADANGRALKRIPKMGIRALWFDQPTILPALWMQGDTAAATPTPRDEMGELATHAPQAAALQGLSCAGYGSAVVVTATMGMVAADEAIRWALSVAAT